MFERYHETIRFLEGLQNVPGQKDYMTDRNDPEVYLKRTRYFLELIPDIRRQGLRRAGGLASSFKFIHVAGTSGKGSVTAMLHEVLSAAGKRVGSFTSPFTSTAIEKIRVGDKYISPQELTEIVAELKPYITRAYMESPYGGPSYFEIWFAIAVKYFLRKKCDFAVLEVGLGGKYDPGVLLSGCVATVLTNVDYDHTDLLGRTLTKIGREKAGMMRRGVPFFTAERRPQLTRMFEKMARKVNVKIFLVTPPNLPFKRGGNKLISPPLGGGVRGGVQTHPGMDYQGRNAALVKAVAEYLKVPERAIVKGIERARLPCRFEVMPNIRRQGLRRAGGLASPIVVLDGAHSVAKMKCTLVNLARVHAELRGTSRLSKSRNYAEKLGNVRVHLVLAIAANKDIDGICKVIVPRADRVYVTRFDMALRESAHPQDLIRAVQKYARRTARAEVYMDSRDALDAALTTAGASDLVIVTGSFFLAGELRKRWYSEERILRTLSSF